MILAGGANSRFGGVPKGLELVGGRRIVDRVEQALRGVTDHVLLAANVPDASHWLPGVAIVPDRAAGAGGLAGVDAALSRGGDVLVVAWDMPFVTSEVLRVIADRARAKDADIVVPESESPFGFEPFCGFYSSRVAASLKLFLDDGGRAPRDFLAGSTRVERIASADFGSHSGHRFMSVNTPEELDKARALADSTA